MPAYYRIYGLTLCVNRPLPILLPAPVTDAECVTVELNEQSGRERLANLQPVTLKDNSWQYWSPTRVEEVTDGNTRYLWIHFSGEIEFLINRAGTEISGWWPESLSLDNVVSYLIGPILGTVLRLRGATVLHACCIGVNGQAIAMLGDAGAGKSSLTATFARLGYPILTDDLVALNEHDGSYMVQPGHPWVFVPPETVEALYGAPDALPQAVPPWPKRRLDLTSEGHHFQREPLPLRGIYLIGKRSTSARAPFMRRVRARRALLALLINSHAARRVQVGQPDRDFIVLSQIAASLPVKRVTPFADRARLPDLCKAIVDDFVKSTGHAAH